MRKYIVLALLLLCLLILSSCQGSIKEYSGTPLTDLTFESIDYNGGYTETYIFDFDENHVKYRGWIPNESENSEFKLIAEFTDEEEKILIDKLYTYGLFSIKKKYEPVLDISFDGSGWRLYIEYQDGTTKESEGSKRSPTNVFSDCAKAFYDICGKGIVARVPSEYYSPPNVSYAFSTSSNETDLFDGYPSFMVRANYQWNGFESKGNHICDLNESAEFSIIYHEDVEYGLTLYTANYGRYEDYDRFQKCIVTSYDYSKELSNEKIHYSGKWFDQIEFELELDRIYLVRLEFKNGDFVEYTFNTRPND